MTSVGATHDFLGGVLPDKDFRAEIFSLVEAAWPNVPSPRDAWLEPRITGLLQMAMIQVQESRYDADAPFDVREDIKLRHSTSGKETERLDLGIWLRHHYIKGYKPYFVFEAKRLNVSIGDVLRPEAHEYVGDGGMGCLLIGGYNTVPNHSGMLAYVMDGNVTSAKRSVEKNLANKSGEVRLRGDAKIHPSAWMPKGSPHGETHHTTGSQPAVLFHMFLAVTRPRR